MLENVFYTATHFGFGIISFLRGENKVPFHVSVHRPDESDWALQV